MSRCVPDAGFPSAIQSVRMEIGIKTNVFSSNRRTRKITRVGFKCHRENVIFTRASITLQSKNNSNPTSGVIFTRSVLRFVKVGNCTLLQTLLRSADHQQVCTRCYQVIMRISYSFSCFFTEQSDILHAFKHIFYNVTYEISMTLRHYYG